MTRRSDGCPLAIQTTGLVKRYGSGRRATAALTGLDLTVENGEVFGFLGPNGAGKTTTIRILIDLLRPSAGQVRVLGTDPRDAVTLRQQVGYLAGDFLVGGKQTGRELLTYLGSLRGGMTADRIDSLARRLDLDLTRRIGALSKGNRQKVGLIQAFMHRPRLLILDEPTSGLDPFLQQQYAALVAEARADGATIFVSSHVMSEVQQTCDRVGIIRDGALVAVEEIERLRAKAVRRVTIQFADSVDTPEFASLPGVSEVVVDGNVLRCRLAGDADALVKAAARHTVRDLTSEEPELEEHFSLAIGVAAAVVVVGYLANAFLPQAEGLEWTRTVSPFHWYLGGDPLINGIQWGGAGLLAGCTAIVLALGVLRFQRRDLGV